MENWKNDFIKILGNSKLNTNDIEKAFELKSKNIPSLLYQFRPDTDYAIKNFLDGVLYLSSPQKFNDPYDAKPLFNPDKVIKLSLEEKYIREYLYKLVGSNDIFSEDFTDKTKYLMNKLQNLLISQTNNLGISCFTENDYKNVLMWSHYANYHKGFCVEYDIRNFDDNNFLRFLYPVIYSNEIYDLAEHLFAMLKSYTHPKHPTFNNIVNMTVVPLYKSLEWQYEKEWRLVIDKNLIRLDDNKLTISQKPKAIYLGVNIKKEVKKTLKSFADDNNIPLFEMYQKGNEYKLIAKDFSGEILKKQEV